MDTSIQTDPTRTAAPVSTKRYKTFRGHVGKLFAAAS